MRGVFSLSARNRQAKCTHAHTGHMSASKNQPVPSVSGITNVVQRLRTRGSRGVCKYTAVRSSPWRVTRTNAAFSG